MENRHCPIFTSKKTKYLDLLHQSGSYYEVRFQARNTFRYYVTIEAWHSTPTRASINGEQRNARYSQAGAIN